MNETTTGPTREQVEAMQQALGCKRGERRAWSPVAQPWCTEHPLNDQTALYWAELGCPVAVAAARHEVEAIATALAERGA